MNLQPIKDALAAATPGPWTLGTPFLPDRGITNSVWATKQDGWNVSTFQIDGVVTPRNVNDGDAAQIFAHWQAHSEQDARLIANAPTWLAALVAEVERYQAFADAASRVVQSVCHCEKCELYREKVERFRDELVTEIDSLRRWQDQAVAFIGRYHVYNLNPAERAEAERLLRTDL